jgi:hypothetical protein
VKNKDKPRDSQNWSKWTGQYLSAITTASTKKASYQELSNLAAGFTTYVTLGMRGWTVLGIPAAHWWLPAAEVGYAIPSSGREVHLIAQMTTKAGLKMTGLFHVESFIAVNEIDKIVATVELIAKEIEKLLEMAYWSSQTKEYLSKENAFIVIVSYGSQAGAMTGPNSLKKALEAANLNGVPVYVVYVDENNKVQGYCVGAGCSDEILRKLALDIFGVEIGKEWSPPLGPPLPDVVFDPRDIEP